MIRVIIESPYATGAGRTVEQNEEYARKCLAHSLSRGEAPFASHLLYTQEGVLNDLAPKERSQGIEAGFEWGCAADLAVFYIDHGMSLGMCDAAKIHQKHGVQMEFRRLPTTIKSEIHNE